MPRPSMRTGFRGSLSLEASEMKPALCIEPMGSRAKAKLMTMALVAPAPWPRNPLMIIPHPLQSGRIEIGCLSIAAAMDD